MKTIVHIGQHKTETTSIQKLLQDNRESLISNGLYVPSSIAGYKNPSHFILNVYALDKDRYSSMKERIVENKGLQYISELEGKIHRDIERIYQDAIHHQCDRVIWSNEGLYLLNSKNEYSRLTQLFSQYFAEVEVVCCFRDTASYRGSYIKQLKKQNISLSNNSTSYRYVEPDSWLFDYSGKKRLLSEVFDKCTYFSYDPDDNVKQFMKAIGQPANSTEDYRLNVTQKGRKHVSLLRRLKKRLMFWRTG